MGKEKQHTESMLEEITRAVLYEGYSLFPYNRSATKNVKPVPFGAIYPQAYQKYNPEIHATSRTECVLEGTGETELEVRIRFLHLRSKKILKIDLEGVGQDQFKPIDTLRAGGKTYASGWEAVEREIDFGKHAVAELLKENIEREIASEGEETNELIYDEQGQIVGNRFVQQSELGGAASLWARPAEGKAGFRIMVTITNATSVSNPKTCSRNEVYARSFLSAHTILTAEKGHFISLTDPEPGWKKLVSHCNNINTWPVLIDAEDKTMLSSPIVLYDHPQIAPESTGDLFDSTEIEEALILHIATLPEEERKRIDDSDDKMRTMMERVENITPEELKKLHGGFKEAATRYRKSKQKPES